MARRGKELSVAELVHNIETAPSRVPNRAFAYLIHQNLNAMTRASREVDNTGNPITSEKADEVMAYGISNLKWLIAKGNFEQRKLNQDINSTAQQAIVEHQERANRFLKEKGVI